MYHPPDYIDNVIAERQLKHVLNCLISEWNVRHVDIASGFFEPEVWAHIGGAFSTLAGLRLLLGRAPDLEAKAENDGAIDLRAFYRDKLRENLDALPLDRSRADLMDDLIAFLLRDTVEVRYYTKAFLHAKAYLMEHAAIVGSSNFTPSGLTRRAELNLVSKQDAAIADLREQWFELMWGEGDDHKADLIAALDESKFGKVSWTPYQVFIKVLYEYFKDRLLPDMPDRGLGVALASFQQEGLREAVRLIDRHGGVIVSDAVGLGKTYIGMGLLEHYVLGKRSRGFIPKGLVICPAQLRDLVWEPKLNEYGIKADVLSMEMLGRESFAWQDYSEYDVVLVDESHNFRNPATNRYVNLMRLLGTGKPKRTILMTATPVNNSIWDLYHQVSLLTSGRDAFFLGEGIRNLKGFFKAVQDGSADMFTLLEQVMVRRSRQDVKQRQELGEVIELPGKGVIHFPERRLHSIEYDLEGTYDGAYSAIVNLIESLQLVSYNIDSYKQKQDDDETKRSIQSSEALIGILKTLYLKRLESSLRAFTISVDRQIQFQERFLSLLLENKFLDAAANRRLVLLETLDDAGDLLAAFHDDLPDINAAEYDIKKIRRHVEEDIKVLKLIQTQAQIAQGGTKEDGSRRDAKLARVKALLAGELAGRKTLLFSYYHDTAQYVYESLLRDSAWLQAWTQRAGRPPVIEVIHGGTDGARRELLVQRFAPKANAPDGGSERALDGEPEIDLLISTDVLSEGQNLQDAGVIINYDLHWTPIRMIQRAGRIDRLGSEFALLEIYNCFPQRGLEDLLRLVARLQDRIRQIDSTVGLDASVLGELISERSLAQLRALRHHDADILDELERDDELVSTDEMKLPLLLYMSQVGDSKLREIPRGIGSGRGEDPRRPVKGVFFAFQAEDRHYWRLHTADEVITDKRRLFRWLIADPGEPRVMPPGFSIFDVLDQAAEATLKEINAIRRGALLPRPLGQVNRELQAALNQPSYFGTPEADEHQRNTVLAVVQDPNISLDTFKKDKRLKAIRQAFTESRNTRQFVEELDQYFLDNNLYRDVTPKTTLQLLHDEDLQLVAYCVMG